jgi:hypothetical protein
MTLRPALQFPLRHVLYGWLVATLLSGLPSTLHALATGGDVMEATRAAALMILPAGGTGDWSLPEIFLAAGVVHGSISLFWALLLACVLPVRGVAAWAVAASAGIALLDLGLIAPALFPEVAALAVPPQVADHLMWGACYGVTLARMARQGRRPA